MFRYVASVAPKSGLPAATERPPHEPVPLDANPKRPHPRPAHRRLRPSPHPTPRGAHHAKTQETRQLCQQTRARELGESPPLLQRSPRHQTSRLQTPQEAAMTTDAITILLATIS